jgi:hypothetical protein
MKVQHRRAFRGIFARKGAWMLGFASVLAAFGDEMQQTNASPAR